MPRQPIGSSIERAGLQRGPLIRLLAGQIARKHIMANRQDAAVAIGGQTETLDRIGTMRGDVKDLLPRQRRFHWSLELLRGNRRQNGIGVDPEFAAESA